MYDKPDWIFSLKNIFEKLDGLTSEQAYRRIVDNIVEFDESFDAGDSPQQAHQDYWS